MRIDRSRLLGRLKGRDQLGWIVSLLMSAGELLFPTVSALAQTNLDSTQQKKEIMAIISNYVQAVCPDPSIESRRKVVEWNVEGEAKLNKILRKIASIGGEVWYQEQTETSVGILQQYLPNALKNTTDCRKELTELFVRTFFPAGSHAASMREDAPSGRSTSPWPGPSDAGTQSISEGNAQKFTTFIVSGSSNNPELEASRRLQKALEAHQYRVLPAQERGKADIIIEISMSKGDDPDCNTNIIDKCLVEIGVYYHAYWAASRKEILAPNAATQPEVGKPSVALSTAADHAAEMVATMLSQQLSS